MSGNFVSPEKWGKHLIHSPKTIDFNAQFVFIFNIQGGHNTINTRQNKLKLLMLYWTFAVLSGILSPLSCNQWHKYCSYSCKEIWASPQGEEWLLKSTCPHWNQLVHTCEGMKLSNVNNNDWQVAEICLKKIIFCSSFILDTKTDTKYIPKIITNLCGRVVGYWEGVAYLTFPTRGGLYIPCDLSHDACYVSTPPPPTEWPETCQNITFPQLLLRTVAIIISS